VDQANPGMVHVAFLVAMPSSSGNGEGRRVVEFVVVDVESVLGEGKGMGAEGGAGVKE
jgi:hypothetical protein